MRTTPAYNLLRHELYIACDDFNFDWTKWAVHKFDEMWKEGKSLLEISRHMHRAEIDLFMLYLDRVYKGKIEPDMKRIFQP